MDLTRCGTSTHQHANAHTNARSHSCKQERTQTRARTRVYIHLAHPYAHAHAQVVLSALKEKVIRVRQDGGTGSWLATTSIGGHGDAVPLKAVHVQMSAKAWVPTVAYVELFGGAGEYEQVGAS